MSQRFIGRIKHILWRIKHIVSVKTTKTIMWWDVIMRSRRSIGIWLLGAGVLLAALGLMRGEACAVLEKGINLCLQCMGLG
jgi:hypothetical protein